MLMPGMLRNSTGWTDVVLLASLTLIDLDKIVVNLSSFPLSDVEIQLLSKGLQFSIPSQRLDPTDVRTSFELMFNQAATWIHSNLTRLKHRLRSLCYTYIYSLCSDCSPLTV